MFVAHPAEGYLPVRVLSEEADGHVLVEGEVEECLQQWLVPATAETYRCHGTEVELAPDNLLSLADYNYAALLHALRLRHHRQQPYTWIGPVLVSINPCTDLKSFSSEVVRQYMRRDPEPVPHLFATVNKAVEGGTPAAILVTGESGAGKTEAVKAMLSYLVERQGTQNDHVCDVLLGSTQALEAFGNARTLQNGNSSRFGKLTQVLLDPTSGRARGAAVVPYMLEASRVTHHARGEFNYHIFYVLSEVLEKGASRWHAEFWKRPDLLRSWMRLSDIASCAGLANSPYLASLPTQSISALHGSPRLTQLALDGARSARSQRKSSGGSAPGEDGEAFSRDNMADAGSMQDIVHSLGSIGLSSEDVLATFQVVLAVALLGNVAACDAAPPPAPSTDADHGEDRASGLGAAFGSPDVAAGCGRRRGLEQMPALNAVAELLEVPMADLQDFLATRTTDAPRGGERFVQPRTTREIITLRDSMAREIYTALFAWLVRRVAAAAAPKDHEVLAPTSERHHIAILDIYGFEVCQTNGLEQMLINYCNERLQALFNAQMFAAEAREYESEGLPPEVWTSLCETHELPALPLFEGGDSLQRRSPGLFALVDDEARCRFNDGSNTALRSKMDAALNGCAGYKACRSISCFAVAHFAGDVVYDSRNFIETNVNAARPEILSFLSSSSESKFLRSVLATRMEGGKQEASGAEVTTARRRQLFGRTVVQAFRAELDQLINSFEVENTQCYYVRCLKPNRALQPGQFDGDSVLRQCRYSGLLETVQIRQHGYPHRRLIHDFVERYAAVAWPVDLVSRTRHLPKRLRHLSDMQQITWASSIARIVLYHGCLEEDDIIIGHSKVFMRARAFSFLEARYTCVSEKMLPVQAAYRRHLHRSKYTASQRLVSRLQALYRGNRARKLVSQYRSLVRLQAVWRGYRIRRAVQAHREVRAREEHAVVILQRFYRDYLRHQIRIAAISWLKRPPSSIQTSLQRAKVSAAKRHGHRSDVQQSRVPDFRIQHSDSKENRPPSQKRNTRSSNMAGILKGLPKEAVPSRESIREARQQSEHKVQMDAVQERFDELRQHRAQILRERAEVRPPSSASRASSQRRQNTSQMSSGSFMTQHSRGEVNRDRTASSSSCAMAGAPSTRGRLNVGDSVGSACHLASPHGDQDRVTDPWAAFAVNRRDHGSVCSSVGTPGRLASPQSARRRPDIPSRVCTAVPGKSRSTSPCERTIRRNGDIVQDLRARCGNISAVQHRIDKDFAAESPASQRFSSSRLTTPSPGRRCISARASQETRQISPAPSRPRSGFSTPGPPQRQGLSTPPSKKAAAVGINRSPSRSKGGTPLSRSTAPLISPQRQRRSVEVRSPSPLQSSSRARALTPQQQQRVPAHARWHV